MMDRMTLNYIFFLGILIPTIITVALFIVFIYFWKRNKLRQEIMTKLHNPHKKNYYYQYGFKSSSGTTKVVAAPKNLFQLPKHSQLPGNHHQDNHAYEETPDSPNYGDDLSGTMYKTCHDSGMSELSEMQYKFEEERPYSQASTDSEDSGFRSSRSGQYLHSAQNSTVQEVPILNPLCTNATNFCQTTNLKCSDTKRSSSHRSKRKNKSPKSQRHKHAESLDLYDIHAEMKSPTVSTISQKPRQLTITTAMVHRPILTIDENSNPVSYSVV